MLSAAGGDAVSSDGPSEPASCVPLSALSLHGPIVRLEPLAPRHAEGLALAAADRHGPEYTAIPVGLDDTYRYIRAAIAAPERRLAFAVVSVGDGAVMGSTSFVSPLRWSNEPHDRAVSTIEIGGTWYAASVRGSAVNPSCKLLMLQHAFDVWKARRVEFRTDERNEQSRRAISRLGATEEGLLRAFQPGRGQDGSGGARNTVVFSIVDSEWPGVRSALIERLASIDHAASPSPPVQGA